MLDNPYLSEDQPQALCPSCQRPFRQRRGNQRFCSRPCQKNATRGSRKVADSFEEKRRSHVHYNRAMWLAHDLYSTRPDQRLGLVASLIEAARTHDAQLRSILTDPTLLNASPDDPGLFFRRCPYTYKTISQAANAYCRKFWGHGVSDVIYKRCKEPDTGEVRDNPPPHL